MKDPKINLDEVRRLLAVFDKNSLAELQVEEDGIKLSLRREVPMAVQPIFAPITPDGASLAPVSVVEFEPEPEAALPENTIEILSPMTGIFYHTPTPGAPPFVEIGDMVEIGQTVGLIEAMKVFSDVPADAAGRVVALPAKSGELVHQGRPIVVLEPVA